MKYDWKHHKVLSIICAIQQVNKAFNYLTFFYLGIVQSKSLILFFFCSLDKCELWSLSTLRKDVVNLPWALTPSCKLSCPASRHSRPWNERQFSPSSLLDPESATNVFLKIIASLLSVSMFVSILHTMLTWSRASVTAASICFSSGGKSVLSQLAFVLGVWVVSGFGSGRVTRRLWCVNSGVEQTRQKPLSNFA